MIEVRRLHKRFGSVVAVEDVSFAASDGMVTGLLGPNGAGKTTTLRNVSRLVRPTAGRITFEGQDLARLRAHEVVAAGVVQVPEGRRIFPEMTVFEASQSQGPNWRYSS